jgi:AcrR family transcriptional regulator
MARTRASDFETKQRSILKHAAAVFAELGMEKASMSQVASRTGVSKALLYHYYPGKDALIFDIIRTHLGELDEAIASADLPGAPPAERLRRLVRAVLDNYRDADDYHKVQLNAAGALTDEQRAGIRQLERSIVGRFAVVLREIDPRLDTRDKPLLMPVTMSLFGMMNWVYMWFRDGGALTRDDYADVATTLILDGIRGLQRSADVTAARSSPPS